MSGWLPSVRVSQLEESLQQRPLVVTLEGRPTFPGKRLPRPLRATPQVLGQRVCTPWGTGLDVSPPPDSRRTPLLGTSTQEPYLRWSPGGRCS